MWKGCCQNYMSNEPYRRGDQSVSSSKVKCSIMETSDAVELECQPEQAERDCKGNTCE